MVKKRYVLTSKMSVSIRGKNLKNTIINGQDTNIKCPTTQVKNKDVLLPTLFIQTICDGGCSWFIDNSGNIQSGNNTRILSSLPLGIIEVCCILNKKILMSKAKINNKRER